MKYVDDLIKRNVFRARFLPGGIYRRTEAHENETYVLPDFSLTVKAATLLFISGRGSAFSSAKAGKSGFIYNLEKN